MGAHSGSSSGSPSLERRAARVPVVYRLCREEDLPALEWMGLFTAHRDVIRRTFLDQLEGRAWMLLGVANEFPVAQVWIDPLHRGSIRCPRLWAVRVFPALQGAGIGARMISIAEDWIARHGAKQAELGVEPQNERARQFYERLGYKFVRHIQEQEEYCFEGRRCTMTIDQAILRKELPRSPKQVSGWAAA